MSRINVEFEAPKAIKKILVSGPGLIGQKHIEMIQNHPRLEIGAIVSPNGIDSSLDQKLFHSCYDSMEQALESKSIDGAIISSPNEYHFEQALNCIKRQLPVLIEKPLTDNLRDAQSIVEIAKQYNSPVLVGHHRTYSSLLSHAKKILASKDFGQLIGVQGSALFFKPDDYFQKGPWRTKIGGGPLLINLIHEIGVMRYLCGEIETVSALASNATRNFEVEDTAVINFTFDSGALGSFIISDAAASNRSWEQTSGENPSYPTYPQQSCYHFAGTKGSLDFPNMKFRHFSDDVQPSWWEAFKEQDLAFSRNDPLEEQLNHFINVIEGRSQPLVSAEDGYQNMLVLEALRISIETGNLISIKDIYQNDYNANLI